MAALGYKEARALVSDLFEPRPWIYWVDFLASVSVGYAAAILLIQQKFPWSANILLYFVAIAALYRASLFMHEISHYQDRKLPGFKLTWNLLAGIPLLLPSFFYEPHRDHHNTRHYGTEADGEYLPLARDGWWGLVKYFAQVLYLPLLTYVRFAIVAPLSFLHPRWRRWVLEHWSSFVINLHHRRIVRANDPTKTWALMEIACHLRALAIPVAVITGLNPWYTPFLLYGIAVGTLTLNHIRTLAAHRYRSDGESMTLDDQMLDSTDIAASDLLTLAICPVGLRYHALHHLFPGMPYHNLGTAHRRLMEQLPCNHPYRRVVRHSLWAAIGELIQQIRQTQSHGNDQQFASGQAA